MQGLGLLQGLDMAQKDHHFYAGLGFNARSASMAHERGKNVTRYFALRGPQMARKGLIRAGFNPILAVGGLNSPTAPGVPSARGQAGGSSALAGSGPAQDQADTAKRLSQGQLSVMSAQADLLAAQTARNLAETDWISRRAPLGRILEDIGKHGEAGVEWLKRKISDAMKPGDTGKTEADREEPIDISPGPRSKYDKDGNPVGLR